VIATIKKTCAFCKTTFSCGEDCWCTNFPVIMPIDMGKRCLCKTCLTQEIKEKITTYLEQLTPSKIKRIQGMGKPKNCIEGIDYNLNDNGAWVFSGWYLLRQGACCTNNCTNCPYPKK